MVFGILSPWILSNGFRCYIGKGREFISVTNHEGVSPIHDVWLSYVVTAGPIGQVSEHILQTFPFYIISTKLEWHQTPLHIAFVPSTALVLL